MIPALLLFLLLPTASAEQRSVSTSWGVVQGELVQPGDDLPPVAQFLGIPYGVAPSGQFRFNMAISAAKWTHMPKETKRLPNSCIQTQLPELSETRAFKHTSAQRFDLIHRLLPKLKQQSEDCLFMNLFVPERLESSHRDSPLPVLVLVHGDDYGWGGANPYNGTFLAAHGQIIVVSLNYRLGVYGFLGRCESSSCSGNSGISDLVSALTMLNVVLPAFGGDPRAVTLLGWGSGASLVSLLMASPLTQPGKRLFRRAVLLDGTALAPWAMSHDPQAYFFQLAEKLGCVSKNRSAFGESIDTVVRCLQEHSAANVTKASQKIEIPSFLSAFAPIVDGQLIPNRPRLSFSPQHGSLFREIDLLVGTTSNPAHHLLSNEDLLHGIGRERREKVFRTLIRNLFDYHRTELLAAVTNEYTDWENPKDHPKSIRNGVLSALGDVMYTAPLIETLRLHSSDESRKQANTFMFIFAHETRAWLSEQPNSGVRGALSGDHLPYILGYPLSNGEKEDKLYLGFNNDDKGLSRVMMHYISNFVKSGDPSKPLPMPKSFPLGDSYHSTAWPQFDEKNREAYLEITDRPRVKNYYRNAQVAFWTSFVPQLNSNGKEGVAVDQEHHFLPDHMKRDTFFGRVRPFASHMNDPFPPPPLPPAPPPENLKKISTPRPPTTLSPVSEPTSVHTSDSGVKMFTLTVIVGCCLLLLNLCIFLGLYRNCNGRKGQKMKKLEMQFQTYNANHPAPDPYNNLNSPLSLMPPPPPSVTYGITSLHENELFDRPLFNNAPPSCGSLPRHSFQEQEPLLAASSQKNSVGQRPGVSPTCPRHGRAALAVHSSRGNSVASAASSHPPPLEEIQV